MVRDTGIEPVTSSVSGKRSPAELIARVQHGGGDGNRTRVHGFAGRCLTTRPLHRWGLMRLAPRADDGIRTRDPHLGKVMRYQLRYIRAPRTTCRPSRRTTIVHKSVAAQIRISAGVIKVRTAGRPREKSRSRGRF